MAEATARGGGGSFLHGLTAKPWWPTAKKVLAIGFVAVVFGLLADHARHVDWAGVWRAMRALPAGALLTAGALTAASYALYSGYDLVGQHETGHRLSLVQVLGVTFVTYAFNINLGAMVGAVAMRFRLYGRLGLKADVITRILALSWVTNWLGYIALGGAVFAISPLALPPGWKIGSEGLRYVGIALLLVAAGYIGACFWARGREWDVRGHAVRLPSGRLALLQLGVSTLNWCVIAAVVWTLLQHRIDYPTVLSVLLLAAVAGVAARVPAGLGVLEAVFVALLSHRIPKTELIAALLAYRVTYYLVPLALAIVLYGVLEARAGKEKAGAGKQMAAGGKRSANEGRKRADGGKKTAGAGRRK